MYIPAFFLQKATKIDYLLMARRIVQDSHVGRGKWQEARSKKTRKQEAPTKLVEAVKP